MADRNQSDLDREQRGSSNPNQSENKENRSTQSTETGMGGSQGGQTPNKTREGLDSDRGVGSESESEDRGQGNVGSSREGNRSTGNIEGDENLNRR